jgi:hypothetical protein
MRFFGFFKAEIKTLYALGQHSQNIYILFFDFCQKLEFFVKCSFWCY